MSTNTLPEVTCRNANWNRSDTLYLIKTYRVSTTETTLSGVWQILEFLATSGNTVYNELKLSLLHILFWNFFFSFSVVFGILQAKDRGRLCWRSKPNYVPDWSKGHYDGVTPHYAMQDSDNETELPPPAKVQTFFPLTVAYKYHHSTGAQNVWQIVS